MVENESGVKNSAEGVSTITQSVVDKPLWELMAQRIKKVDVTSKRAYLDSYIGGVGIGILLFLSFFFVGKGFGSFEAVRNLVASVMNGLFPAHTEKILFFKPYLTSSVNPLNSWFIYLLIGIALGALVSGLRGKRMKMGFVKESGSTDRRRIVTAFAGGFLVTFGASMAGGGIVSLGISETALLGMSGWLFLLSVIIAGVVTAFFVKRNWL